MGVLKASDSVLLLIEDEFLGNFNERWNPL
nr:MAG TPA: Protein of unknown function (DUF3126) [Caudoviricetes sp.]DAK65381.1 MAG TPA: Protein of unknown function (DUF3126) [Caudoviricetes sp.]DAK65413.1 MAG TPA: Protein of unknown function (DUF3126) [Caudoviricetes sp.]DAN06142.1 MAG TPA: Protein of unknown function (DUF3126) [Caudoviricetes sp.]DAP16981.1 MAG TPA: Protein of unknown function (DUF3126) [Caudoviricetes sp.]